MNPGMTEEAGRSVRSVITALKSEPLVLAMALMNVALLVLFFYYVSHQLENSSRNVRLVLEAQQNIYQQWSTLINQNNELAGKILNCILIDDAVKLLNSQKPTKDDAASPARP